MKMATFQAAVNRYQYPLVRRAVSVANIEVGMKLVVKFEVTTMFHRHFGRTIVCHCHIK